MIKIYLSSGDVETLSITEKIAYFDRMREACLNMKGKSRKNHLLQKGVTGIIPHMRNYGLEINNTENIPRDSNVLFLCNHSNAHDFLTMQEIFKKMKCNITFLASNEGIGPIIKNIFTACGGVLIDRNDKLSIEKGVMAFCANILGVSVKMGR